MKGGIDVALGASTAGLDTRCVSALQRDMGTTPAAFLPGCRRAASFQPGSVRCYV